MIHGVGKGTHQLYMEKRTHERLISWLHANRADVWTAPLVEVAKHVRNHKRCESDESDQIAQRDQTIRR